MKYTLKHPDTVGAINSSLCVAHCFATPFLFLTINGPKICDINIDPFIPTFISSWSCFIEKFSKFIFLAFLLIYGYQINKKNSASKKNEISNITKQLNTRNIQLEKIQKQLEEEIKNPF